MNKIQVVVKTNESRCELFLVEASQVLMLRQIHEYVIQIGKYPCARRKELPTPTLHIDRPDLTRPREEVLK